jgi:choline dehydrogenase-like flavoprotein
MQRTFDYIIVGGGTAGAVVARRLADALPDAQIALLEAGPSAEFDGFVRDYRNWISMFGGALDFGDVTEPLRCNGARMKHPRGRLLGGCSAHNTVIGFRMPDADAAAWERLGCAGWGVDDMRRVWRNVLARTRTHEAPRVNTSALAFMRAAAQAGFPEFPANGDDFQHGSLWLHVNEVDGARMSSAAAYLFPLASLPRNLHVLTDTPVTRIVLDAERRAVAVDTPLGQVNARAEIILCAGAFDSPRLLMLSGIGPAAHLADVGVMPIVDAPDVGAHLQDHVESVVMFETTQPVPDTGSQHWENAVFATTQPNLSAFDVMIHFGSEGYYVDMDAYVSSGQRAQDAALATSALKQGHVFCMTPNTARPASEGRVWLRSTDPADRARIDPAYYTDADDADVRTVVAGIKLSRQIAAQPALRAWIARELAPGPGVTSDAALAAYVRQTAATVYHPVGTCRMGATGATDAVVDPQLCVCGVRGLRVADASIMPRHVGVNPCLTVMQIGERCAELILASR